MRFFLYPVAAIALAVAWPHPAHSQTVPPATTSAEAKPDFSGTWSLDRNLSDDPSRANFEASRPQSGRGGFGGRSSRRGGGPGGFGGSQPGNRDTAAASTPDERTRLQALTDQLKQASASLVISHHDPSFVIDDAQDHAQFFETSGTTDEHHLGSLTITSTTHWDGSRLVTAYELSSRQKLVYTYTLLPKTKQLVLRVRLDATEGQRANRPELMLVYTLASSESK
jgi:hypothetical protein